MVQNLMIRIPFLSGEDSYLLNSSRNTKGQHLVNCALPGLAKKNGLKKEEGWKILKANLATLATKIKLLEASDLGSRNEAVVLRSQVQDWCRANVNNFSKLGLNVIKNHKPKANVNDPMYRQLVCIALLDEIFARKGYIQKEIVRGHKKAEKPPLRQRLRWWWQDIKRIFLD